jgi:penicillin-binding protein 2A
MASPLSKQTPSNDVKVKASSDKKPSKKNKKMKKRNKWLLGLSITLFLGVFAAISLYLIINLAGEKLLKENVHRLKMDQTTFIYDKDGNQLTSVYRQNRELVSRSEMPDQLVNAFIAVEDKRFLDHTGFDMRAVMRALYRDIAARAKKEGGSTITQQLAKTMFLNSDKTLFRKVRELSLALALENNFTKDQIMEMYLNSIYFGNGAYGVKTASELFFNKSDLKKLDLWEMATLAAIPKAPTKFSPLNNPEESKNRRNVVLKLMLDQGYITEQERLDAAAKEFDPTSIRKKKVEFSSFIDYAIDEVEEVYGISEEELLRSGYKIYTTMDRSAQKILEDEFANKNNFPASGPKQIAQGAMVILNQFNGEIVGMIGGRNYVVKGLNRVLVRRQPGSAFKPIVSFAPAIEAGRNPNERIPDRPMVFKSDKTYRPKNIGNRYRGSVDMFSAMKYSYNIPAVALLDEYGVENGYNFARKLGVDLSAKDKNLMIALGGLAYGATPLEMARAFATFANYGEMVESHTIIKITDADGNEINPFLSDKKRELKTTRVMKEATANLLTQLLQGVVKGGTGTAANFGRPLAGKTGTTESGLKGNSGNRDVWFVGYTPELTAAVWIGFDRTDRQHYLRQSSSLAAKLYKTIMSEVLEGRPKSDFNLVDGVYPAEKWQKPKGASGLTATITPQRSIRLEWQGNEDDGLSYRIYRKDTSGGEFSIIRETTDLSYIDNEIQPLTTYEYYIESIRPETGVTGEKSDSYTVSVPSEDDLANLEPDNASEPDQPLDIPELPTPEEITDEIVDPILEEVTPE